MDAKDRKRIELELRETQPQLAAELEAINRFHELASRLFKAPDLKSALDEILQAAVALHGADMGNVQIYHPSTQSLDIVAQRGFEQEFLDSFRTVGVTASSACGRAMKEGRRVVIEDVESDPLFEPYRGIAAAAGFRAVQSTPLMSRHGELLGILSTHFRQPHRPSDLDLKMLDHYARHAADVIERTRMEAALRETEQRFRAFAMNVPAAVFIKDLEGRYTFANPKSCEILGRPAGIVGLTAHDLLPAAIADNLRRHDLEVASTGRAVQREEIVGDRIYLTIKFPSLDIHDLPVGVCGVAVDITERNQTETELHRLTSELEKRVAERTAALEEANRALVCDMAEREKLEEQLRQAQKMESIGTLAGGIAHDFNNILNIIRGYTFQLAELAAGDEEIAGNVGVIDEAVGRGASIVEQLLTLARKTEAELKPTNVDLVIDRLVSLLKEILPKNIEVKSDLDRKPPAVMANANQISQALLNLCLNARDAMPGGGTLTLRSRVVEGDSLPDRFEVRARRYVCIEVNDSGGGMDEGVQSRIFEPFFTTKEFGRGTGLGLSVVYGIIRGHAGQIHMESEPGRGTTFRIYLPVLQDEAAAVEQKPRSESNKTEKKAPEGNRTILFVEDEARQLRLMQKVLEGEGYKVLGAKDGAEAVQTYLKRRHEIALVILDLGLPKLNGWEAFQRMKEVNPDLKAIIATGYVSRQIESSMAKGDLSQVILKPYRLDEVLEKISGILG